MATAVNSVLCKTCPGSSEGTASVVSDECGGFPSSVFDVGVELGTWAKRRCVGCDFVDECERFG